VADPEVMLSELVTPTCMIFLSNCVTPPHRRGEWHRSHTHYGSQKTSTSDFQYNTSRVLKRAL